MSFSRSSTFVSNEASPAILATSSLEIAVSIDETSALVAAISAANAASSADTLESIDVKSVFVAAISSCKATTSAEILTSNDWSPAILAASSVDKAVSIDSNLSPIVFASITKEASRLAQLDEASN